MFKKGNLMFLLILVSFVMASIAIGGRSTDQSSKRPYRSNVIGDVKYLQVNNLSIPFGNNGIISDVGDGLPGPLHGSYAEFPAGSDIHFIFSSGFWVSGFIDGELWASGVASASRVQDYIEGNVGTDRGAPENKIYVVTSQDGPGSAAYVDWATAVANGADFVDNNGDGAYDPNVDAPDLLGDQMLWFVVNDGAPTGNRRWAGSQIVGMEVQVTAWAFARGGALGNIAFIRFRLVNKGTKTIEDMYFTSWHDPDLGEYTDDLVGCDVALSAGFTYNEGSDGDYGDAPPAFLVDFFQGPLVVSPGDTAFVVRGPNLGVEEVLDHKTLGMSSFTQYIQSDPTLGDPDTQQEARNYMTGLTQKGEVFDPLTRGVGGSADDDPNFWYSGDPETGQGWLQSGGDDQRMLLNTGPFRMDPGDEHDIVTAFVVGQGNGPLNSVTVAKGVDALAQSIFDFNFDVAGPPPAPKVESIVTQNEDGDYVVELFWEASHIVRDRQQKAGADQRFEGFVVKQFRSNSTGETEGGKENARVIARFDVNNELGDIYVDTDQGRVLSFPSLNNLDAETFAAGEGIILRVPVDKDVFTGEAFKLGTPYYFGVIAYNVNRDPLSIEALRPNENTPATEDWVAPAPSSILANSLSVGLNFIEVIPGETEALTYTFGNAAAHDGGSDGTVTWDVIKPQDVTGHDYEVTFAVETDTNSANVGETYWTLTDKTSGQAVMDKVFNQSGTGFPVVEGIQVSVFSPPAGIRTVDRSVGPEDGGPGGERWVSGVNWGGAWMFGGLDEGRFFFGSTLTPEELVTVDLRFTSNPTMSEDNGWSRAYVYRRDQGYAIQAQLGWIPMQAFDISTDPDNPRQLNICFNEDARAGVGYADLIWNPMDPSGGDNSLGNREYIWVMKSDYDPDGGIYDDDNWGPAADVLYAWWPVKRGSRPYQLSDFWVRIAPNFPNTPDDKFSFSTADVAPSEANSLSLKRQNFKIANVFPNPYLANNPLESPRFEEKQFVTFTHLSNNVRIRIYTISGKLVRTLEKNDESPFLRWDLQNESALKVASGVYIAHIEAKDIGVQKILKLAVIQRESRLQRF
ncbi:MAG: T9SS type A sorting domain-containing protein [bacterium]